ncbi:MAG: hypothetical protein IKH04_09325 [Kiritimatiellae bacterium]|nr:hypothetical protein [Kiritimatiellia bacterium]
MNARTMCIALHFTIAAAATMAFGGVKYWDNPDFKAYDADSYVTIDLTLNYDGIRNVGLGQEHSCDTLYWANLGPNSPAKNLEWSSRGTASLAASRRIDTHGSWAENGFQFDGAACWIKWNNNGENPVVVPANYTMQFVMTANAADQVGDGQTGYIFFPHDSFGWTNGTVALRSSANTGVTVANALYAVDASRLSGTGVRPHFAKANPRYATVMSDSTALRVFEGTTLPASGDSGFAEITGISPSRSMNVIALGGIYTKVGNKSGDSSFSTANFQGFTGTLHSYRLYSRALTEEELAWNRVVDEKRFFGIQLPIPATNAVIRSNLRLVSGPEPVGCYAVDAGGHTFTAPAMTNISGHTYALLSATKETWDATAGAWGAAEAVAVGANGASVVVASSELVRISWKWQPVGGAFTAADYSIDDIVTDGLVLHYDGILNVGRDKGHSTSTTIWENLAEGYKQFYMDWVSYTGEAPTIKRNKDNTTYGRWDANGFAFDGRVGWMKWNNNNGRDAFTLTEQYTMQFAMTANAVDQTGAGQTGYLFVPHSTPGWTNSAVAIRSSANGTTTPANAVYATGDVRLGGYNNRPYFVNAHPRYATVIVDDASMRVFEGTDIPASDASVCQVVNPVSYTMTWFSVGAQGRWADNIKSVDDLQGFHGTLHAMRLYDRPLAEWELKRNRNVDANRFFGALGVTNVVVEVEEGSGITATPAADEAYFVEGSHTFTATGPAGLGYRLSVPDGNGGWQVQDTFTEGDTYTYTDGTSPALVKLEWRVQKPFVMVVR